MSVSETAAGTEQLRGGGERTVSTVTAFVARLLRELLLLGALAGWLLLWGVTAALNYRQGDLIGLGLVVGVLIRPVVAGYLWHLAATVTDDTVNLPWHSTGADGATPS
ncbi:hypothetical protein BRC93_14460 [Halobacteriales archaeon QS_5_70_15]|nr:MAG: hypothetical protein BRC93_14460 [Halobacteriales archaeon QS_5_70_15]